MPHGCAEEAADLLYHVAVLMEAKGFGWDDVVDRAEEPVTRRRAAPPLHRRGRGVAAAMTAPRQSRRLPPVADMAAGGADHRDERIIIVGLEPAFDHQVERARREPRISVTVVAVARDPAATPHAVERRCLCASNRNGSVVDRRASDKSRASAGSDRCAAHHRAPATPRRRCRRKYRRASAHL